MQKPFSRPFAVFALAASAIALCAPHVRADVTMPAIFSDHMVLQRDVRVPVWGFASAGEKVTVEFAGQVQSTTAGADGKWQVALTHLSSASAPQTLTIKGNNTLVIQDVLVGEVWLGSGQSNMAFTVNRGKDFEAEKAAANYPLIRHYKEDSPNAATPQAVGKGHWEICTPETVPGFSAVLYFFGRELHQTLKAPVGLINSSVGGTPIEAWIAADVQLADTDLSAAIAAQPKAPVAPKAAAQAPATDATASATPAKQQPPAKKVAKKAAPAPRSTTGGLFNGKIAPLIPFSVRGILWYQGEANTTPAKTHLYQYHLPLLIRDWRARWGSELPFAWVQLPNFTVADRIWPPVREAMLKTLALPKTGMAIAIDVGESNDIHPKDKQTVGHRLAQWALGTVYDQKVASTSGPLPAGHEIRGREIVLRFSHADGGLVAKDGPLTGFVIAGPDHTWIPAQARIEGSTVVVSAPGVAQPVAARYAWENFPTCNLFNAAGLPASPFRTDDWK
ncbi:MAG: sialate O-acetylesterase [Verrucomicrobia bacterium]|nr:sialate O-acetylesterase [Verrucomicrobiota bacterium]